MDELQIYGLQLFAHHGVNPEETEHGQLFVLDILLHADLTNARKTDDLTQTVNYAQVVKTVRAAFTAKPCLLIEHAAQVVCERVLEAFPTVQSITLTLKKPDAPMKAQVDFVAVKITQQRS